MKKKNYRIKAAPSYQKGGIPKNNFAPSYLPIYHPSEEWNTPDTEVRSSVQAVPEDMANLEAEGGETMYVPNNGGLPAHYDITGPRHSEGGVPLSAPPDSFIFSDTRSMKIPSELNKFFGKGGTKKYTPADLAKQYDINKFRKQLQDPDSDPIQVSTAEMMIANYNKKLGMLGLAQESLKGFPDGIPSVAMPYLATSGIDPASVLPLRGTPGQETQDLQQDPTTGAYGGQYQYGGDNSFQNGAQGTGYQTGGGTGYEIPDNGYGSPAYQASMKFWHPQDENIGVGEWAKTAFDYIPKRFNQELTGYYEDPSTTIQRGHAPNAARDWSADFFLNPTNWALTKDIATLAGKGVVKSAPYIVKGLKTLASTTGVKNAIRWASTQPWFSQLASTPHYLQAFAEDVVANPSTYTKLSKYLPSVASSIVRAAPSAPVTQAPLIAQDNLQIPKVDQSVPMQFQAPKQDLSQRPDTLFHYQTGGPTNDLKHGWYKEGKKYVLYNNNQPVSSQDSDPKLGPVATKKVSQKASNTVPGGISAWPGDRNDKSNASKYSSAQWQEFARAFCPECKTNEELQQKILTEPQFADDVKALHDTYGMPAAGKMTDNKLGHRWDFVFKAAPQAAVPNTPAKREIAQGKPGPYTYGDTSAPFWAQDQIQTLGAAGDSLRLKKYLPWAPKVEPYIPNATFYDPTRALAANTEAANLQTQGASTFGTPQQFSARSSGIQGQHAKAVADTLGQYNNMNVGVANQAAAQKASIYNQANEYNANTAKDLYDKTTIANQQFDNSKAQARDTLRQSFISAITNRADAQRENMMYPEYHVDPSTGGLGYRTGYHDKLDPSYYNPQGSEQSWIDAHSNLTPSQQWAYDYYDKTHNPKDYIDEEKLKRMQQGRYPGRGR